MIKKDQVEKIMDALSLKCWGIIYMDQTYVKTMRQLSYFSCENSILEAADVCDLTVIAISVPYDMVGFAKPQNGMMGKIDAFAWTFDYHVVLKALLYKIKEQFHGIEPISDENVMYCVDNSPFNDREVGFYAGLGQVGYNHLLINEKLGTHHFIGYLVIKQSFAFDEDVLSKIENLPKTIEHPTCQACGKCVKACPVSVCGISNAPQHSMNRCLSALTQTKEFIDSTLFSSFGERLYGCNTCQIVCPINKAVNVQPIIKLTEPNWIDVFEVLDWTKQSFKIKYGAMGFAWRSLWIYKRNALIVIGNSKNKEALSRLSDYSALLEDEKLSHYYKWSMEQLEHYK